MTPDEWRAKHKCCANCIYFYYYGDCDFKLSDGLCTVKNRDKVGTLRRFCKIYKAEKFDYSEVKK